MHNKLNPIHKTHGYKLTPIYRLEKGFSSSPYYARLSCRLHGHQRALPLAVYFGISYVCMPGIIRTFHLSVHWPATTDEGAKWNSARRPRRSQTDSDVTLLVWLTSEGIGDIIASNLTRLRSIVDSTAAHTRLCEFEPRVGILFFF